MSKFLLSSACAVLFFAPTLYGETDRSWSDIAGCLLPAPVRVERAAGCADAAALTRVDFVRADIGAPAAVRAESYRLEIGAHGVRVTAPDERGRRHALTTLAQLKSLADGGPVPAMTVTDWPIAKWRGLLFDCGRNYVSLPLIYATIDFLAAYKYNVFHWHLSDYHGWRLESKRYPELQRPEAFTRQIGRYYTQAEFKAVVAYAAARGVTIVPEIDVPGHSAAFRRAFGYAKMNTPGAETKICDLIDELCSLADAQTMPVVHLGTDEVRNKDEYVPEEWYALWAQRVADNRRTVMGWWPGHKLSCTGTVFQEMWYETRTPTGPYVDAVVCYIDSFSPWSLLAQAAFKKVGGFYSSVPADWLQGGEVEAWHDDPVQESEDVVRDNALFPSLLFFSDMLWHGNEANATNYVYAPPPPGTDAFARLADLERRVLAQRDRPLRDFPYPLQLVRQTEMRWHVKDADGQPLADNVPCGTVYARSPRYDWGYPTGHVAPTGTVTLTTEILSDRDQDVGAFIELSEFHRSGARSYGLPAAGQWNRYGATVKLNDELVLPPVWNHPGAHGNELKDVPWTDECAWIRPPTPIRLRKGVNRVEIVLPKPDDQWYWSASFVPVTGTREHPREVPGISYR